MTADYWREQYEEAIAELQAAHHGFEIAQRFISDRVNYNSADVAMSQQRIEQFLRDKKQPLRKPGGDGVEYGAR